jgi:uncharacterized protein (DUF302 family)
MVSSGEGLVHLSSSRSALDTANSLERVVLGRGLRMIARIDHAGDAAKVGLTMHPSELLIFGNPIAGTPLMVASPTLAIDLPLKALVWQDVDGQVWLSYNHPHYMQERHQIPDSLLNNIAGLRSICEEVVRPRAVQEGITQ